MKSPASFTAGLLAPWILIYLYCAIMQRDPYWFQKIAKTWRPEEQSGFAKAVLGLMIPYYLGFILVRLLKREWEKCER